MGDLICRQAAIDALRNYLVGKNVPCDGTLTARLIENEVVNKLPSAQPELKKGKWIRNGWAITCSECGYDMPYTVRNFCPNCGADMRGEQNAER